MNETNETVIPDTEERSKKELSYHVGTGPRYVYPRLRDYLTQRFSRSSLLVVRIRSDFSQDHRVFDIGHHSQLIHWDNQTYDIEHDAIIKDCGHNVMYIIKGCRKPIDPHAWLNACVALADAKNKAMVDGIDSEELKLYGKISMDARTAWLKMNNKDAALLGSSAARDYSQLTAIVAGVALLGVVVLVLQSYGVIPSKTGVQMDYVIQVGTDLMDHYGVHFGR